MIEVKLDDRIIKVQPDLTLDKFMKIQKNPIKYNNTEELLSLYLDVEVDEIKDLPKNNVKFIENFITQNVINQDTDKMTFTFELDGITYGFENDWKNIKWGQWVDMEVFSSKDKIFDNIHVIMSLLYRPVLTQKGTKYTIEPYKSSTVMERAELFLTRVPIQIWFGCSNFFFLISSQYISNIKNSLERTNKMNNLLMKTWKFLPKFLHPKLLPVSTSNLLTNSQMTTSPSLNK